MDIKIVPIKKRYWWPHPFYFEAKRNNYNCLHKYLPCIDLTIGFKYYIDNIELPILLNTHPQ